VTQNRDVEIEEQTDRAPGELQVSDHLSVVNRSECPDRLYLNQHAFLDNQVGTKTDVELGVPVVHRKAALALHAETLGANLAREAGFVDRLEGDQDRLLCGPR